MEKLYTVNKTRRVVTDCDADHELLIAKFRHKLKTVGKTTRPFRYDLILHPCLHSVDLKCDPKCSLPLWHELCNTTPFYG